LKAFPDDVYLAVAKQKSPKSEYMDKKWGELWDAFEQSGFLPGAVDVIKNNMPASDRQQAEEVFAQATELLGDIDWLAFIENQFAFGMRFEEYKGLSQNPNDYIPSFAFLSLLDDAIVEQQFTGISELAAKVSEFHEVIQFESTETTFKLSITEAQVTFEVYGERIGSIILVSLHEGFAKEMVTLLTEEGGNHLINHTRITPIWSTGFPCLIPSSAILTGARFWISFSQPSPMESNQITIPILRSWNLFSGLLTVYLRKFASSSEPPPSDASKVIRLLKNR
jgi:hypothetical protein